MCNWPHSPARRTIGPGTYILTASTLSKERLFRDAERLNLLQDMIVRTWAEFGWQLQAWAVFQNHYHLIACQAEADGRLSELVGKVHACTSRELNRLDGTPGRKVWHQFWDTLLTTQTAYFARLAYVHRNPVRHGLVGAPEMYPWSSANWFRNTSDQAFYETVMSFKTDRVNVYDEFEVEGGLQL